MYIEARVAPDCRSARNNLYSGISLVRQVRSLISLPCSVSLCFWSFLVSSFPRFLVSSFPRFPFPVSRFTTFDPIPDSGLSFASAIPISPFASAIPISSFAVAIPIPRSHQRFRSPFRFPFPVPVPVLVPVPRGSASRCFSLRSHAALLYKESA